MIAIFKKEFMSYLHSVIGLLFIAVTAFFFGLYSAVYNMVSGHPSVAYSLNSIIFLFMLSIPLLSMRIFSEERKQKTDQLILTAPISVGKIVVGKYLAMSVYFLIPVALICGVTFYLQRFGNVMIGESFVAILAFTLYGLAGLAIGMFISSITESQVIAAVLSFAAMFITYMMSGITGLISSTGNVVTEFLGIFDFATRFSTMMNGVLELTTVVYFVSIIVLLLFLTAQSIQKRRYSVSIKNISMGAYSAVTVVVAVVIVVVVNIVVGKLPSKYVSLDMTTNKLYSITEQTEEVLRNLKEDIRIYVINSEDNCDTNIAQTLKCYEDGSAHVTVEYIDPLVNPTFVSQYTDSNASKNSIVVESDKRYKFIDYNSLYEIYYDYTTYEQSVTGYDAEGQITSAIGYCVSDDMPKIYMISGHNEYSFDTAFTERIERENIEYETISLIEHASVPADAECVIIHAPTVDFSEDDANKIIDYLNGGGKVMITTEYAGKLPNLERIMDEFGLGLCQGYVVENDTSNYYQSPLYLLPDVKSAVETAKLTGKYIYVFAPYAQGVVVPEEDIDTISYTPLLVTSDSAFVKTNLSTSTYEKEEGDIDGPVTIAVKAEKTLGKVTNESGETEENTATLYVFTSAQMFTSNADSVVSGNNQALFSNIMGTIADHEVSVSIPVKSYELEYLSASAKDINIYQTIMVIVVPVVILIAGIVIWIRRRKR